LPLPLTAQAIVAQVAGLSSTLIAQSCQTVYGASAYAYLDRVVDALRASDTRWGYVCKRGSCAEISGDVIAYHATAGPDVQGATGTWEVDILANHCPDPGMTTTPQWAVLGFSAAGVWGTRGRF